MLLPPAAQQAGRQSAKPTGMRRLTASRAWGCTLPAESWRPIEAGARLLDLGRQAGGADHHARHARVAGYEEERARVLLPLLLQHACIGRDRGCSRWLPLKERGRPP